MATSVTHRNPTQARRGSLGAWLRRSHWLSHALIVLFLVLVFVPLLWLISTSFKDRVEFSTNPAGLIPRSISLINYQYLLSWRLAPRCCRWCWHRWRAMASHACAFAGAT